MTTRTTDRGESLVTRVSLFGNARCGYAPAPARRRIRRRPTPTSKPRAPGQSSTPFRFSLEYADDTLALGYYNYRRYNPADDRWTRRDIVFTVNELSFKVFERQFIYKDTLLISQYVDNLTGNHGKNPWTDLTFRWGLNVEPSVHHQVLKDLHAIRFDDQYKCFLQISCASNLPQAFNNKIDRRRFDKRPLLCCHKCRGAEGGR